MPKLTDTQLVILSAAVTRKSRSILPLPKSIKAGQGTVTRLLKALMKTGLAEEQPAGRGIESWRVDDDGQRFALLITNSGRAALDGGASPETSKSPKHRGRRGKTHGKATATAEAGSQPERTQRGKVGQIASLLQRATGAPLPELQKATGWQPHSVRAALTGLRKQGYTVLREKQDGITRYRIVAA